MYKMLIVDDEPLIRTGLKNMIEWEVYGIEIVGEAEDGMKAYQQIKALCPEIALIDISMPNMSGLELMELCSHLVSPPSFIILSGYNDFEYVQTAIKYGAVNYLLKPVDQDELTNTIMGTVKLLEDDRTQKLYFQEGIQALKNDTLIRLLNRQIESRELREKSHFLNLSFRCSSMRVGLLKASGQEEHPLPAFSLSDIERCKSFCSQICPCYTAIDFSGTIIFILKDHSHELAEDDFNRLLNGCAQQLSEESGLTFFTSLGPNASNANELSLSYRSAMLAIEKKRAFENVLTHNMLLQEEQDPNSALSLSPELLIPCLSDNDMPKLRQIIRSYFYNISAQPCGIDLEHIKYSLVESMIGIMQKLSTSTLTDSNISTLKQNAFSAIRSADSLAALEEHLLLFFPVLADQLSENTNPEYSFLVRNALNYVRDNYHDCNLSLKTLAGQMGVNASYLGRQFSLETKEYFSDYLNRIRISQALQLLDDTSWKVSKVAETVGFANVSYFFTIFKKITGKSPGDYRRNL